MCALPSVRQAQPDLRFIAHAAASFPRRPTVKTDIQAGLPASGSYYRLRLPVVRLASVSQWHRAAFVPGYGGGTATDLHRLPYSSANATSDGGHPSRAGDGNGSGNGVNQRLRLRGPLMACPRRRKRCGDRLVYPVDARRRRSFKARPRPVSGNEVATMRFKSSASSRRNAA